MAITLKDLLDIVKGLPEECFDETHEKLTEIKKRLEDEKESGERGCPHCESPQTVRNGKNRGRQMYLCGDCKKAFSETSASAVSHSHSGPTEYADPNWTV